MVGGGYKIFCFFLRVVLSSFVCNYFFSLLSLFLFAHTYSHQHVTHNIPHTKKTGLAEHKDTLGSPLCPCRHYDDKEAEVKAGFWNCPCIPMRERKECHCMLFLTDDNDFAGDDNTITMDELKETIEDM